MVNEPQKSAIGTGFPVGVGVDTMKNIIINFLQRLHSEAYPQWWPEGHQPLYGPARYHDNLTVQLLPNLLRPVDVKVLVPNPLDLRANSASRRARFGNREGFASRALRSE